MKRLITILLCLMSFSVYAKTGKFTYKAAEGCTPLEMKIPEESSTQISCKAKKDLPLTHYYAWLPKGYNEQADKRSYPFLVIDNAGGKSQNQLKKFRDWAAANKWILFMPVEISNNNKDSFKH